MGSLDFKSEERRELLEETLAPTTGGIIRMIDIFTNLVFDVTHMESSAEYDKWPRCKNQRLVNSAEIIILGNTKMVFITFERIGIKIRGYQTQQK